MVRQVPIELGVEVVGLRLLRDLLHLVDGDWHPGCDRRLLLPSLVVVPAVWELAVRSADVGHPVSVAAETQVTTGVGGVGQRSGKGGFWRALNGGTVGP